MSARPAVYLSLLLVSTVLTAAPAFAVDSVASNKGPGPAPDTRAAPVALPGKVKPMPIPRFDPANMSRGLGGMQEDAAIDSMATISRAPDGSVSETPASADMRGLVGDTVKSSSKQMGTARTVVGTDDRGQLTDGTAFPAAVVGWLWAQDQAGEWSSCTATLIGPSTIVTAAHCVYDLATQSFVKAATFYPGMTDGQTAPFGTFDVSYINILKGFTENYDGKNYGSVMPWDLAELELSSDAGNQIGWLGFGPDSETPFHATMIGYPGDKPDGTMWQDSCDIAADQYGEEVYWHDCDTYPGSSGSTMWADDGTGNNTVIHGINVAEDDTRNYAVRLTRENVQFLNDNYK